MFSNFTKSEYRLEKKFIIEENNISSFKAYLATNFFKKAYPDREVNSIYVDTINLDDLSDNINGIKRRTKHRFRWYEKKLDHVQFEQKNKHNFYGWKNKLLAGSFTLDKLSPNSSGSTISPPVQLYPLAYINLKSKCLAML